MALRPFASLRVTVVAGVTVGSRVTVDKQGDTRQRLPLEDWFLMLNVSGGMKFSIPGG